MAQAVTPRGAAGGCNWQWVQIGNMAYWCCIRSDGESWCDEKGIQVPGKGQEQGAPGPAQRYSSSAPRPQTQRRSNPCWTNPSA